MGDDEVIILPAISVFSTPKTPNGQVKNIIHIISKVKNLIHIISVFLCCFSDLVSYGVLLVFLVVGFPWVICQDRPRGYPPTLFKGFSFFAPSRVKFRDFLSCLNWYLVTWQLTCWWPPGPWSLGGLWFPGDDLSK